MEISFILNVIFISLLAIGFLSYMIWLGVNLVKVKKQQTNIIEEIQYTNRIIREDLDKSIQYLEKRIDKLDSKIDREDKYLADEIEKLRNDFEKYSEYVKERYDDLMKNKIDKNDGEIIHRPIEKE